ncbi:MAG TPA: glycosyltransferase family 4 protein [Marmoricola sp.]|nr:glycosyltransferase family 4 protein [Marmoricola sp.]
MRILLHDYSGHPFQVELSRELSRRGHDVLHSHCAAHSSGKGNLDPVPGETLRIEAIGVGEVVDKLSFGRRLVQEVRFGVQLLAQVRRERPDVVLLSNVPIPMVGVCMVGMALMRRPWVLWQQDVQAVAMRSFAGKQLSRSFVAVARVSELVEKWSARLARHVVVIADSFVDVHESWGTAARTTVIPNWAPLEEIRPVARSNDWSLEHGLDDVPTLLYSGTLGLKHNPGLLVGLAREVIDAGQPVQLVVVNEGPAEEVLREEAARHGVPLLLLPFQPYERLSEVLGTADVLVVLLEQDAGAFSVPSKTLSYLCAGRPILGLMPAENLAATLVQEIDGCVLPPQPSSLPEAAAWVRSMLGDAQAADTVGKAARVLAEREFALDRCADRFEQILVGAAAG